MTPSPSLSGSAPGARRAAAVLVTGAGGEMGHGLLHALHESLAGTGRAVVAVDLRELPAEHRSLCTETIAADVCDAGLVDRLVAGYEIGEIYHLAALLSTRGEFSPEAAHNVNVNGTVNLLRLAAEQARSHGAPVKFVFPSSIAVYGMPDLATKNTAPPVREEQYCHPITMYGCNKLYGEELGRYYARHYRLLAKDRMPNPIDFRSIRFPGIISAETVPSGGTSDYAPEMIHAAASGQAYRCFVRPDTRIPFMTMPDAIDALLALASADASRLTRCVYNVTSFSPSAAEIAELVATFLPGSEVEFAPDAARQQIVDSWPAETDDGAARRDWGYAPKHGLREAFEAYLVPSITARYQRA